MSGGGKQTPLMQDCTYGSFISGSRNNESFPTDPVLWVEGNHLRGGGGAAGASTNGFSGTGFVPTPANNPSDSTGFMRPTSGSAKFTDLLDGANILYWDGHVEWTPAGLLKDAGMPEDNATAQRHCMSGPGPYR